MIVFDLRCDAGHVFEAWFGSSADYDDQCARGLVSCPLCGVAQVTKAVMAPAVPAKGNSSQGMTALLAAQRRMEADSDYVGDRFAAEARERHESDTPGRPIYGEATIAEARALVEEGIGVVPLPFVPLVRSDA